MTGVSERLYSDMQRVLRYAGRWGVSVVPRPHFSNRGYTQDGPQTDNAPRSQGWIERTPHGSTIVWHPNDFLPMAFLHELSHCVIGVAPDAVDEIESGMLAWEYHSARYLHLEGWSVWMADYAVPDLFLEWCYISPRVRGKILAKSAQQAVVVGILTATGKPTFQRVVKA